MNTITDEFSRRVAKAANDLRMVQISFADEPPERRREYLVEALDRALEPVLPAQRADFLAALGAQFPAWAAETPAAAPEPEPPPEPPEESAEALTERFIEHISLLEEDEREKLVARLRDAGLVAPTAAGAAEPATGAQLPKHVEEAAQYLMHKLGLSKLDLVRAIKLMVRLVEQTGAQDQVIWNTWRVIAPRSPYRRPSELRKDMVRYIGGDRDISGQQLVGFLDKLAKLTAALIAGVGQLGPAFARSHLLKFSPQEIEARVAGAGGSLLVSKEYKCWERYVELSHELDENSIEHAIREVIAQKTEALLAKTSQ